MLSESPLPRSIDPVDHSLALVVEGVDEKGF